MASLNTGGGSSAVAASAHAGCQRFRHTDPLVIGRSRRSLAAHLGHPDTSAGIPEARWMRAMTFEALVRHDRFVSQLLTTAVGRLGLDRPAAVRRANGGVTPDATATVLQEAHRAAVDLNQATMITGLAVPYVGMEHVDATPVKPDFAIVAPRPAGARAGAGVDDAAGSWLIMGDAKDYERVRSRVDDQRLLKGFLQVALGAESAGHWSRLPVGMKVHPSGALAVPRNAFLQPEAVVERLDDHRVEVRARVEERAALMAELGTTPIPDSELGDFVNHLDATFDPASCVTCALFNLCRSEVRASSAAGAVLMEIGVRPELRAALGCLIDGSGRPERVPASVVAMVDATLSGEAVWAGQARIDPAGLPGTINVVLAKSDAAALGVHGLGIRRIPLDGSPGDWAFTVFDDPQSPATRLSVVELLGRAIGASMADYRARNPEQPEPVHLVLPDAVTGDLLVSIADSLAGVETSRLRWARDLAVGREALTYDGEPAVVPDPLTDSQRLAVSFLLEEDRARAMSLRWPLVNLRTALARHLIPGGPAVDHGRLDYLVEWARAAGPLDHRRVSDEIASRESTPGARLSNSRSDAIHQARRRDPARYASLVEDELTYKAATIDAALEVLDRIPDSRLRPLYRALEATSQEVWRRRLQLQASDLVRFGRTSWFWRNNQVPMLDADRTCADQLALLANPQVARDMALDAGTREVALATVVGTAPLRLRVASRRLVADASIVALHRNGTPCAESPTVEVKIQKGSFKLSRMLGGSLAADADTPADGALVWETAKTVAVDVAVGDELIVANRAWLGGLKAADEIRVDRPKADENTAPKPSCDASSYRLDPEGHQWCCRPHQAAEAEFADLLAERRERGELNPTVWPPVIDYDQFDTPAAGSPTGADLADHTARPPDDLTPDDID